MTYACAIPPLDQSATSLGWSPGFYRRNPCGVLDTCSWNDDSLQFLANPGTPVVAPFPVRVVSTSPFVLRPNFTLDWGYHDVATDIRITGVTPAVSAGAVLDKGALLGRIARDQRGTKWMLWGVNALGRAASQQFIVPLFRSVGLEIVGAHPQEQTGFDRTPNFGGRLLARAGGPADCSGSTLRGLGAYLGSAPSGYVETSSSVYDRYGTSGQSDTSVPPPRHENVARQVAEGGAGLLGVAALAALGWWWMQRGS